MKTRFLTMLFALALMVPFAAADTVVVNFDNLPNDPFGAAVPNGYGGINWGPDFGVWSTCCGYAPHSGSNVLLGNRLTTGAADMGMDFVGGPVVFNGAWLSGFGDASFTLYLGGVAVGSSNMSLTYGSSVFLSSGYAGLVDQVVLNAYRGSFVMDDVTYQTQTEVTETPEPGSLILLGSGMIGAAGAIRRKLVA